MTPLEVVTSLLNVMSDKQRDQVAKRLRLSVCERNGHNYRPVGVEARWFLPPRVKCVCTKCGRVLKS